MMTKVSWNKKRDIRNWLTYYPDIYAVESELTKNVTYGVSDGLFAILCHDGAAYCPIDETPYMAKLIVHEGIREEIMQIYADVKDLQKMGVNFGRKEKNHGEMA